jgi:hypothetical protein
LFENDCDVVTGKGTDADADADDDDGGNNNAKDNDGVNDNDEEDCDDDDNCRFDSNNVDDNLRFDSTEAIFSVFAACFDLPFLTTFVGVTIEIDGLDLLEVLASDSV